MTTATANRIARLIDKAQQAGWDVTREQEDGWSLVHLTRPNLWKYTIGSRDTDGNRGRTYVSRFIDGSLPVETVTMRTLERDIYSHLERAGRRYAAA